MAAQSTTRGRLRRLAELRPERGRVLSIFFNLDPSEFATPAGTGHRGQLGRHRRGPQGRRGSTASSTTSAPRCARTSSACARCCRAPTSPRTAPTASRSTPAARPTCSRSSASPHPIESRAVVDDHPCVEPLIRSGPDERWCVLLVNRKTARIFAGEATGLQEVDHIEGDTHRQHDQGGWSQARFQRSVEQEKLNHLGEALDTLFTRFKRRPFDHLVVGAPDELVGEVEQRLHPYLRDRLAGRLHVDVENSSAERGPRRGRRGRRRARRRGRARGARPLQAGRRPRRPRRRRARRGDGGARAGARGHAAARRGLRRAGARRRASRRRSPSRRGSSSCATTTT